MSEILTLTEVAALLRVRRAVAWRLVRSGRLPSFRVGKAYRVQRADFETFCKPTRRRAK